MEQSMERNGGDNPGEEGAQPKTSLEEVKQRGRQLRSANKERSLFTGVVESLTLESLNNQPNGVGLLYDEKMLEHQCEWDSNHPESPERLQAIWDKCRLYNLVDRCSHIPIQKASVEEMALVHSESYLSKLRNSAAMDMEARKQLASKYDAVYFNERSYEAIQLAAGAAIELVDHILQGDIRNGFCLTRPPGHHAMEQEACGYCFVNNVALAAKHAVDVHNLKRVLIVDLDIHHGQGIQYAFYDDPRVLYFSIHRYEHGEFWPNLRQSDYDNIGQAKGRGYNVNVPLNQTEMTVADYLAIFHQILLPIAYEFNPQLVLVACGYDAVMGDIESNSDLIPAAYPHLIHALKSLAAGKLGLILEGGYCIKAQAEAAALTLRELLDDPCPSLEQLVPPKQSTRESILQVLRVLRPYWRSLCYQGDAEDLIELPLYLREIHIPKPGVKFAEPEDSYQLVGDYLSQPEDVKQRLDLALNRIINNTELRMTKYRTCLVYDVRMRLHKCSSSGGHPERPDRITRIFDKHIECGLAQRCHMVESRTATEEELQLAHNPLYIKELKEFQNRDLADLHNIEHEFNSVYLSQEAYACAALAAGSTLNVVDSVLTGESESGVAIVRPPGHHAEEGFCMGFCFFNFVAIAARYAQKHYSLKRILILDWDVHHGNGTQHMFYDDPSVLYISIHRHDNGFFYPAGDGGHHSKVGTGPGEGFNVNIPWAGGGMGDAEYLAAFQQVVMPIAYEYSPELVLVSAGFDAARGDPLGGCKISPEGYGHMMHMLKGLAMGRIVTVLEGGYNLFSISESMAMCTSILLGDLCPQLILPQIPCISAVRSICDVLDTHRRYWKSLCYRVKMPSREATRMWLGDVPEVKLEDRGQGDAATESLTKGIDRVSVGDSIVFEGIDDSSSAQITECEDYALPSFEETFGQKVNSEEPETSVSAVKGEPEDITMSEQEQGSGQSQAEQSQEVVKKDVEDSTEKTTEQSNSEPQKNAEGTMVVSSIDKLQQQDDYRTHQCKSQSWGKDVHLTEKGGGTSEGGAVGGAVGGDNVSDVTMGKDGVLNVDGNTEQSIISYLGAGIGDQDPSQVQMFAVYPKTWCPHLDSVKPVPERGLHILDPCMECGNVGENWVCLVCYEVHCSRYVNEHMLMHGLEKAHVMCLSYADLTVWCYGCDSYVHNQKILEAKKSAHRSKFNEDIPGH